jgi:hypothetical protein
MKTILLLLLTLSTLYSAEKCYADQARTRSQINEAQICLEKEIRLSLELGKKYVKYHDDVLETMKMYLDEKTECKRMYYLYRSNPSSLRRRNYKTCRRQLPYSKRELDKLIRSYGLLSRDYLNFKASIEDLKSTLSLLKMRYNRL